MLHGVMHRAGGCFSDVRPDFPLAGFRLGAALDALTTWVALQSTAGAARGSIAGPSPSEIALLRLGLDGRSGPEIDAELSAHVHIARSALANAARGLSGALDEPERYRLDPEAHAQVYREQLNPLTLHTCGSASSSTRPSIATRQAYMFIGPHGSGATSARLSAARRFGSLSTPIVERELRGHHPSYVELLVAHDKLALQYTAHDAAGWASQLLADAGSADQVLLIERSALRLASYEREASRLRARGYQLTLQVWAVAEPFVQLANHANYELQRALCGFGPFALLSGWVAALRALPGELEQIERSGQADAVQVFSQDGACLYSSHEQPGRAEDARSALQRELSRPLTAAEKAALAQAWTHVWALKQARRAARPDIETARAHRNRALTAAHADPSSAAMLRELLDERAFGAAERFAQSADRGSPL